MSKNKQLSFIPIFNFTRGTYESVDGGRIGHD